MTSEGGGLAGKRIVLGVTGGIAAYKAAELCRLFVKAGATVRVVMTEAATRFIAPLTLQTLSGAPVALDLFDAAQEADIGHIRLADEADLLVVAPATADFIARMAAGMADDLLAAVVLATRAPVLLAPAMNVNMWTNPVTQANLTGLLRNGRVATVGPDRGELACGWIGAGRLIEPADIVAEAARLLAGAAPGGGDLAGRRVVVTAGATREPIDGVRFLGNRSSGKMGAAMAEAAVARGADVTLVAGPEAPAVPGARRIDFETAADLQRVLADLAPRADIVVMAAAVADFRPPSPVAGKLSRRTAGSEIALTLEAVPDLLAGLARARRGARPYLLGFAAETVGGDALAERAAAKLREKRCDAIVANDVSARGIGFGADDNQVTLLFGDGARHEIARAPKRAVADSLWNLLAGRLPAREPADA
ncbi:MAG TPA: bifunctional phosphopantothenoylcysteine decarboxylase/phosphopantothenate--cysteine ligase CoaBC [Polyangia bacterium]